MILFDVDIGPPQPTVLVWVFASVAALAVLVLALY
jgi:hypothetical protein